MEEILRQVQQGKLTVDDAKQQLATYENLGFAKVDHHREKRQGFPETIYGEGKSAEQISVIISAIIKKNNDVLVTRISQNKATEVLKNHPHLIYNAQAEMLFSDSNKGADSNDTYIAVICAGTSDLRVAEEAAITAEAYGCQVRRF